MLAITTKTQYGLLAMLDMADRYGRELVQIRDIVDRCKVPKNYIEQILNRLGKAGLVKSVRGNRGGYELSTHPDSIQVITIIEALEGEIKLLSTPVCQALDEVLLKVSEAVKSLLAISLSELAQRQKALDQQIVFHI